MLKKAIKTALAVILTAGLATSAMAEANVSGKVRNYFGQYTPAKNAAGDSVGRFVNAAEGNVGVKGTVGSITGFIELEVRTSGAQEFKDTKVWTQWNKDALSIKIGRDANVACIDFDGLGGGKTTNLAGYGAYATAAPLGGYIEDDGLFISYNVSGFDLGLTLFTGTGNPMTAKWAGATLDGTTNGSATQLTAAGKAGPVAIRFASTTISYDDPDTAADDSDDANAVGFTHLGVMYPMGDMAISFDYGAASGKDSGGTAYGVTHTGLRFSMKGAGPGKLTVGYDSEADSYDGEASYAYTAISLGYDISMGAGSGLDILYYSTSKAFEDSSIDTATTAFIGAGFYAFF